MHIYKDSIIHIGFKYLRYILWIGGALERTLWKTHFGRGYGTVIRQTNE